MRSLVKVILASALSLTLPKIDKAQSNISVFSTLSYEYGSLKTKGYPLGFGFNLSQNISKNFGLGFNYRSVEMWDNSALEYWPEVSSEKFFVQTYALEAYASSPLYKDSANFSSGPLYGFCFGKAYPMYKNGAVEHPYFLGVFFQLNFGKDFPRVHVSSFIRAEQKMSYFWIDKETLSTFTTTGSNVSIGICIKPHKQIITKSEIYELPGKVSGKMKGL